MNESDRPVVRLSAGQRQSSAASWLVRLLGEAGFEFSQTSLSMDPFIIGAPGRLQITGDGGRLLPVDHRGVERPEPPVRDRSTGSAERQIGFPGFGV